MHVQFDQSAGCRESVTLSRWKDASRLAMHGAMQRRSEGGVLGVDEIFARLDVNHDGGIDEARTWHPCSQARRVGNGSLAMRQKSPGRFSSGPTPELETGLRKHLVGESGLRSSGADKCDHQIAIFDRGVAPGWLVSGKPAWVRMGHPQRDRMACSVLMFALPPASAAGQFSSPRHTIVTRIKR